MRGPSRWQAARRRCTDTTTADAGGTCGRGEIAWPPISRSNAPTTRASCRGSGIHLHPRTRASSEQLLRSVRPVDGLPPALGAHAHRDSEHPAHQYRASSRRPRALLQGFVIGPDHVAADHSAMVPGDDIFHGTGFSGLLHRSRKDIVGARTGKSLGVTGAGMPTSAASGRVGADASSSKGTQPADRLHRARPFLSGSHQERLSRYQATVSVRPSSKRTCGAYLSS